MNEKNKAPEAQDETEYLLLSPENAKRLMESVAEFRAAAPSASASQPVAAQAVVYPPDGTTSPFTVINLGSGKVQMGDCIHDQRLPALWFGKDGKGMGHEEVLNREAKVGETIAVVTFANVEGLDVLLDVVHRIRRASFPDTAPAPSASPAALTERVKHDMKFILNVLEDANAAMPPSAAHRITTGKAIEKARALLAASPADQVVWRPIETAPMDGTEILLFRGPEIFEGKPVPQRVTSGAWIELTETASEYHATTGEYLGQSVQGGEASWMSWDGGFREDAPPTHWMPLPPAPAMGATPATGDKA